MIGIIVRGEGDGRPPGRFTERIEQVLIADLERDGIRPVVDPTLVVRLRAAHIVAAAAWFIEEDGADPAAVA